MSAMEEKYIYGERKTAANVNFGGIWVKDKVYLGIL